MPEPDPPAGPVWDAGPRPLLPVAGQPAERRDAMRSRRRILDAARQLIRDRGVPNVTMNEVAAAAGVGVGTVYRRFTDISGLLHAVLDDRERELQVRMLSGAPPFHPEAPPADQVIAFLELYLDFVEAHADLLYAADTAAPGARLHWGSYQFYRHHLANRVAQLNPALAPGYTADLLLAAADAELYVTQRRDRGLTPDQIKAALAGIVRQLTPGPESGPLLGGRGAGGFEGCHGAGR